MLAGTYIANARGFGFVENGEWEEDLFVPEGRNGGAFHGDTVEVVLLEEGGQGRRRVAAVSKIVARGIKQVVGTYERTRKDSGFVIPDNVRLARDLFVPKGCSLGAVDGHKVVAQITDYGDAGRSPEAKVVEILGHVNDPGVDILSIVRNFELPAEFPEKVLRQASRVSGEVSMADRAGRRDLRDMDMVTIDGEDAKDLDDAVSLSFDGARYHLGVHIADVANYVQENSALDREALKRGTSVYLADRVIPMLPHALSNGICSLNQGEDRLALSCLMEIDLKGEIVDYEICESVINVNRRLTYTLVQHFLDKAEICDINVTFGGTAIPDAAGMVAVDEDAAAVGTADPDAATIASEECAALRPMLIRMADLAALLRKRRMERGSVDFDFPECRILLDEEGHPTDIRPYERNAATDIIEDFMLAANETVARHFYWQELPFVYRVHDVPDPDRLRKLSEFIRNFGYYMKPPGRKNARLDGQVHPREFKKLLAQVSGTPEEALISRMALRSMKQAKYSVECTGHFGLACPHYCHFTSPIRRYPDLQIHRIIKDQLRGRLKEERQEHYREILPQVAKISSETERRADEVERETDKLKKTEYMEGYIGESFDGVISGVTAWGIYVELPNTVEGMVHISRLPGDYYIFDEAGYAVTGERTGRSFKLGMPVRITVDGCDRFHRTIDFSIEE